MCTIFYKYDNIVATIQKKAREYHVWKIFKKIKLDRHSHFNNICTIWSTYNCKTRWNIRSISIILGIVFISMGVLKLVEYYTSETKEDYLLTVALIAVIFGVIVLLLLMQYYHYLE